MEEDVNNSKLFWDGFQWIAKANATNNADPNLLTQTKKMRRVQLSNLPLSMGLSEKDVATLVNKFLIENYLNDEGNQNPIIECKINNQTNTATLELSSVEETNRLIKVDSLKIFSNKCKLTRLGDSQFGTTTNLATLVTNAQTSAQAQAAAFAAMHLIQNKDATTTSFTLSKPALTNVTAVLKITNLVDPMKVEQLQEKDYQEIFEDMIDGFKNFGQIVQLFIVKVSRPNIGAEPGNVLLEFDSRETSERAFNEMSIRKYDNREIKIQYLPEETFKSTFIPLTEEPNVTIYKKLKE